VKFAVATLAEAEFSDWLDYCHLCLLD